MNYAKNLQQKSNSPINIPPSSKPKPLPKNPADVDRENLLDAIEQMKQRHEHDKMAVQELTAGRPKKAGKV